MPLKTFDEYVALAEAAHGHICAGQILGLRMAIHGLELLGLDDPTGAHRKRLITCVEIDRCVTDAVMVVTGCRMGKRALKFHDYGKAAATFCDLQTNRSVRVAALESAKRRAAELFPEIEGKNAQQMEAYRRMSAEELFSWRWVSVRIDPRDLPGYKGPRVTCAMCGEGIAFGREVNGGGTALCRACAGGGYYGAVDA